MALSVLDLFTIGIGPSSSHTVGPMRSGCRFVDRLRQAQAFERVERVEAHLYGSLALTGRGHGTDTAVLLGLEGETPETVDVENVATRVATIRQEMTLQLGGQRGITFVDKRDLLFHKSQCLPAHPNGMRFHAYDAGGVKLLAKTYYSIGGGFVVGEHAVQNDQLAPPGPELPYPWQNAAELLTHCESVGVGIGELTLRNEAVFRPEERTRAALLKVWAAMRACVERGCRREGTLPGPLNVPRRAPKLYRELSEKPAAALADPLTTLDWVSLWAMAVNEENASGGRVVTAPTNSEAGIIPACLHYFVNARLNIGDDAVVRFLVTCGAIGILYKMNASISGAEVGCQGEVGVACSMAAAALCEGMGGSAAQVENAAEIGMEHNLGLTCDPVGGLVQIPCIERNAMGAVKAINAARLALRGDGRHTVSLDKVIATMRQTGADMSVKYKETSRGGLAVNVVEC